MARARLGQSIRGRPVVCLLAALLAATAIGEQRLTIWGTPPRQKPHMTKSAESFPPLPLPVVPQRRTEKKRPPAAPKLIANVKGFSFDGWQGSPGAVDTLLRNARRALDVWYGWEQVDIDQVTRKHEAGIDHRTPILYLCVYYPLNLSEAERAALRRYTLNGGTLLINGCSQPEAYESVRAELAAIFPQHPLRPIPADHPLYHANHELLQVRYLPPSPDPTLEPPAETGRPPLEMIELGTRAAVIVSATDLACGWNQWNNPAVRRVHPEDSTRLGLNIITYVAAEQRFAEFLSRTRQIDGPSIRPRQQLAFVQLIHDGNWDPNPSAVPFFLKELASNTSVAVRFDRITMPLRDPRLFDHPLLFMTGTFPPQLRRDELALLHRYLDNGGTLIAEAAAGRQAFDVAFRRLCRQLYPDRELEPIPADHTLFRAFHKLEQVQVTQRREPIPPRIEAIFVDDRPVILYSPIGLSDGWAQRHSAYARCYTTDDALRLGTNLVVFTMQ